MQTVNLIIICVFWHIPSIEYCKSESITDLIYLQKNVFLIIKYFISYIAHKKQCVSSKISLIREFSNINKIDVDALIRVHVFLYLFSKIIKYILISRWGNINISKTRRVKYLVNYVYNNVLSQQLWRQMLYLVYNVLICIYILKMNIFKN